MAAKKIITPGDRFGRWTIIQEIAPYRLPKTGAAVRKFICKCECGTVREVLVSGLHSGASTSCGCFHSEVTAKIHLAHGHTIGRKRTKVFGAWISMRNRCANPAAPYYADYGGRGIKVCERWNASFEAFHEDIGDPPSPLHSIDRYPDNDGNYEPGNVRWATAKEQRANQRPRRKKTAMPPIDQPCAACIKGPA
jgi:hypothetical protein